MRCCAIIFVLLLSGCGDYEAPVTYCAPEDSERMVAVFEGCVGHIGGSTALQSLEDVDVGDLVDACQHSARRLVCVRQGWRTRNRASTAWVDHPTAQRKGER